MVLTLGFNTLLLFSTILFLWKVDKLVVLVWLLKKGDCGSFETNVLKYRRLRTLHTDGETHLGKTDSVWKVRIISTPWVCKCVKLFSRKVTNSYLQREDCDCSTVSLGRRSEYLLCAVWMQFSASGMDGCNKWVHHTGGRASSLCNNFTTFICVLL